MTLENELGANGPPPPFGFDKDQEAIWDWSPWRKEFNARLSKTKKALLLKFLRINLAVILISVLIGRMLYLNTSINISESSMLTLAIGIVTASAAILTIIIAFLTFWFGSAISSRLGIRSRISDDLLILEDIAEEIQPYSVGPKDNVEEPLKAKVIELAIKSEEFITALKILSGRFRRAAVGTYYDGGEIFNIELVIHDTGGNWFKAFVGILKGHKNHDFARKTWLNASRIAARICALNYELMRASGQLKQIVIFMPLLASVLVTFIFALIVSFMSGIGYGDGSESTLLTVTKLILSSALVIMLPVQLIGIVRYLWSLVSSKYVADETQRTFDTRRSKNIEIEYPLDYKGALKRYANIISKPNREREK